MRARIELALVFTACAAIAYLVTACIAFQAKHPTLNSVQVFMNLETVLTFGAIK